MAERRDISDDLDNVLDATRSNDTSVLQRNPYLFSSGRKSTSNNELSTLHLKWQTIKRSQSFSSQIQQTGIADETDSGPGVTIYGTDNLDKQRRSATKQTLGHNEALYDSGIAELRSFTDSIISAKTGQSKPGRNVDVVETAPPGDQYEYDTDQSLSLKLCGRLNLQQHKLNDTDHGENLETSGQEVMDISGHTNDTVDATFQPTKEIGRSSQRSIRNKNLSFRAKVLKCIEIFGMNSENTKKHLSEVLATAKNYFSEKSDVSIGFKAEDPNVPIVVAVVKEKNADAPQHFLSIQVEQRVINEVSDEATFCLEKEKDLRFSEAEMKTLHMCITKNSPSLLEQHSNIQVISGSHFKCRGYSLNKPQMERTACIVLYVHIKGIIPVNETQFPKEIEGFPVDVREGCFKKFMYQEEAGDSLEYHRNLTVGCHIANCYQMSGSLGAFIQLPNKNVGCLTCWHIFETNESRIELEKDILAHKGFKRDVFQPGPALEHNFKFGEVIAGINQHGNENEIGVDAALIEITEKHREPRNLCLHAGGTTYEFFEGETLNAFDSIHMAQGDHYEIVKYGAQTKLTYGRVQITGAAINNWNPKNLPHEKIRLHQQIEVNPMFPVLKFADIGDSGSPVFLVSENSGEQSMRAMGMLVGGTTYGTGIVTPIWAILDKFDLPNQLLTSDEQRIQKLNRGMNNMTTGMNHMKTVMNHMTGKMEALDSKINTLINNLNRHFQNS